MTTLAIFLAALALAIVTIEGIAQLRREVQWENDETWRRYAKKRWGDPPEGQ